MSSNQSMVKMNKFLLYFMKIKLFSCLWLSDSTVTHIHCHTHFRLYIEMNVYLLKILMERFPLKNVLHKPCLRSLIFLSKRIYLKWNSLYIRYYSLSFERSDLYKIAHKLKLLFVMMFTHMFSFLSLCL